eukprot:1193212-Prorocentrum_minimum.AAC.6
MDWRTVRWAASGTTGTGVGTLGPCHDCTTPQLYHRAVRIITSLLQCLAFFSSMRNFQTPHTYTHFYTSWGCIPSIGPGVWILIPEPAPGSADPPILAMTNQNRWLQCDSDCDHDLFLGLGLCFITVTDSTTGLLLQCDWLAGGSGPGVDPVPGGAGLPAGGGERRALRAGDERGGGDAGRGQGARRAARLLHPLRHHAGVGGGGQAHRPRKRPQVPGRGGCCAAGRSVPSATSTSCPYRHCVNK